MSFETSSGAQRMLKLGLTVVEGAWARVSGRLGARPLSFQLRLLAFVTALPLIALSLVMFGLMVAKERDGVRQALLTTARAVAGHIDSEIETSVAIAHTLAQSRALSDGDWPTFADQARKAIGFVKYAELGFYSPTGEALARTSETVLPSIHPDLQLKRKSSEQGRFQVSNLVASGAGNAPRILVDVPVSRSGQPGYSLLASLSPDEFLDLIDRRYPRLGIVAIIDGKHRFIARAPGRQERVGTMAAPGWIAAIAAAREGWSENISVEGLPILTGHTPTQHGWTVGVAQLESDLATPLNRLLWSLILGGGALALLSLVVAWAMSLRANASMVALAQAARAVGQGRSVPQAPAAFQEAQIISRSLAEASDELQRRAEQLAGINTRLEAEVSDRTADLVAEMKRREEIEAELRQSQKMDAIGQLTGGIAHDFNNMLTIVIGNLDTAQRRLKAAAPAEPSRIERPLEAAMQGARNAAKLTHRLLAFARRQTLAPTAFDMRTLVAGMSDLLARTVGEDVKIETVSGAGLWPVIADPHQLENALINLVVNARDAMPGGGKITIETSNAYLDEAYVARVGDIDAGQYVMLSVSDTGSGIPAAAMDRVFEPFFTTKEAGKGTGLGLAMIHGFVKQSGGHIRIYSEVGQGTAVKIYLPRAAGGIAPQAAIETAEPADVDAEPGETVLLVEDEAALRDYAAGVLEELGYKVLAAADAEAALSIFKSAPRIDLLFTDVVMTGAMNGRQLADRLLAMRPDLPVLFTTGYSRNAIVHHGRLDADVHLLSKPYTRLELSHKVRSLLDAAKAARGTGSQGGRQA